MTTFHLRINLQGALRNKFFDCWTDDDGNELTQEQAKAEIKKMIASGKKHLVLGNCDNQQDGHCMGHPDKPTLEETDQ